MEAFWELLRLLQESNLLTIVGGMNTPLLPSHRQIDSWVLLGQLCMTWAGKSWPKIYHKYSNISIISWKDDRAVHLEMLYGMIILSAPQDWLHGHLGAHNRIKTSVTENHDYRNFTIWFENQGVYWLPFFSKILIIMNYFDRNQITGQFYSLF